MIESINIGGGCVCLASCRTRSSRLNCFHELHGNNCFSPKKLDKHCHINIITKSIDLFHRYERKTVGYVITVKNVSIFVLDPSLRQHTSSCTGL